MGRGFLVADYHREMSQDGRESPPGAATPAPSFTVRFEDGSTPFTVHPGQTLLNAAARAGLELPSSCRTGTCRTCMCLLVNGEVSYRTQWPGLMPEERQEGWILLCIAYAKSDLVLRRARPLKDWRAQSLPAV